jgi:myxalamid-type polyketide synthase MxaE and MxaD
VSAPENQYVARLREAVTALREVRAERDALLAVSAEPIAIIGLGCRFPGGATDPDAYWRLLESGVDAIREIPADRWPAEAVPGNRPEARWAGMLERVEDFDAAFFGISPREAVSLDPQQRLLLEVAWEALEDAGQRPDSLADSAVGVFLGLCSLDYQHRILQQGAERFDAYCTTGNLLSTAAGRLSYVLGLQGPAMSVDTACSSSLVALSLACQSLRAGESDLALAGGVQLLLSPLTMAMVAETQALSPDGRCRTFDSRANGFVRGEGCGIVVLKRLSDAQRDGDPIRALIRGWAVNQDGRSSGLTAPNVLSQQALLRRALDQARVPAELIGYVETHGTGTPLGDPIEADALREVLGKPRADGTSCVLGSVKTNLGHLEAAAGVAGVIKAVLALEHEQIPRNLHFRHLNPRISFDGTPFVIPTETTPWKRGEKRRLAGVSGFGISGTNAHVILEEAPRLAAGEPSTEASSYLLPLSAKSPAALTALARAYAERLTQPDDPGRLSDLVSTASLRRMHHEHRLAVAGRTRAELATALTSLALARESDASPSPRSGAGGRAKVVFVFPGQGSQWLGMGRQLFADEPAFRAAIEECDAAIQREAGFSVRDQLAADEATSRLGEIDVVQPMLFAIAVALAALWRAWGVEPDAVVGHSMGEVAAAHVAGVLSLDDAARVICRRSRLLRRVSGKGAMGLVELTRAEAALAIAGREAQLSVAVSNGPRSTVISGDPEALEDVLAALETRGVFCRRVKVDVASHSPQMDPLREDLLAALTTIQPGHARLGMRSTVTAAAVRGPELDAGYWVENLREPVLFSSVIEGLIDEGFALFVELSPHPILLPSVEENLRAKSRAGASIASLRRNADERGTLLEALGALHVGGVDVEWNRLLPGRARSVSLPGYPWQRERYWIDLEPSSAITPRSSGARRAGHPLLGEAFFPADRPGTHYWEQWLSVSALPYLDEHRVRDQVVFPGAGYVEMALLAGAEIYGEGGFILEDLSFEHLLTLTAGGARRVQVALRDDDGERALFEVSTRDEESRTWTRHARGTLRDVAADLHDGWESPQRVQERCATVREGAAHYARMEARQIHYGPSFQGVERLWMGEAEVLGRVQLPEAAGDASPYQLHPAMLDACFQVAAALFGVGAPDTTFVPVEIERFRVHQRLPRAAWVRAWLADPARESAAFPSVDLSIVDDEGQPLIEVKGLRVHAMARDAAADPFAGCAYTIAWRPRELAATAPESRPALPGKWLIFIDEGGTGAAVAARLREHGESCVEVAAGARFEHRTPDTYTIDPARQDDFQRLFRETIGGDSACRGVAHFWSLDAAPWEATTIDTLLADVRRGSVSTLLLVQELVWQEFRKAPRLLLVTRGAQMVKSDASVSAVSQSPLWGLGRTIAMEQPDLACTRVDLAPARRSSEAALLVDELLRGDGEDQIAFRDEVRLVARLEQGDVETAESPALSANATYLITGGAGGLGLSAASWMVSRGARHLVLVSRSEPSVLAREAIQLMEQAGAEVLTILADVARAAEVDGIFAQIKERLPPLRGIVHAAGVLEDRTLQEMGEEQFWKPIRPKVLGAWNLHAASRSLSLDFFVMYSSAAALLGSPGQGNYAAANAFLDALAHRRVALGLPAMSLQWGAFSEVGLAAAQENRGERLSHRGIESFTPDEGTALLSRLLSRPRAEVGLLRMSVRQWVEFYPRAAAAPFLAGLREEEGRAGHMKIAGRFRETLEALSPGERRPALERHVLECLARVLRLPAERIDTRAPFRGYGMDSLMSLEIRNRLEPSLGLTLSAALLYTYTTTSTLVDHLLVELRLGTEEDPDAMRSPSDDEMELRELSEQAAAALLDEKLLDLEDYLK